jgi:hypothetical protein
LSSSIAPPFEGAEGVIDGVAHAVGPVEAQGRGDAVHPHSTADHCPQARGEGADALDLQIVADRVEVVVEADRQLQREGQPRLAGRDGDQQGVVVAAGLFLVVIADAQLFARGRGVLPAEQAEVGG